jgi:hypothetical protein
MLAAFLLAMAPPLETEPFANVGYWRVKRDAEGRGCVALYGEINDFWIKLTKIPGYYPLFEFRSDGFDGVAPGQRRNVEIWFVRWVNNAPQSFAPRHAKTVIAGLAGDGYSRPGFGLAPDGFMIEDMQRATKMLVRDQTTGRVLASLQMPVSEPLISELERCGASFPPVPASQPSPAPTK